MRRRTTVALTGVLLALAIGGTGVFMSGDVRTIGRTDPKRAANHRLPWRNFSETYTDGEALGVRIGSTRAEAIDAASRSGFTVSPSGWGDSRAGGADLYSRTALLEAMSHQPALYYYDGKDTRRGMTVRFNGDHVTSVSIYYINSEAL